MRTSATQQAIFYSSTMETFPRDRLAFSETSQLLNSVTRTMALGRRYFLLCWLRALVTRLRWSTAGLGTPINTVLRKITVGGIGLCPPAPRASTLVHEHFHGVSQMGQTRGALGVRGTTAGLYPPSDLPCMTSTFKYIQRPWEDDAGSRRTSSFSRE